MALGDWFKIGGRVWNVRVLDVTEEATTLYTENTGRTMAQRAPVTLDALGGFINHKIEIVPKKGYESDFDRLYDFVTIPRNYGIMVEMPHGQSTMQYNAYISSASRKVKRIEENSTTKDVFGETIKIKWDKMSINCIPIEAQKIVQ